MRWMAEAARLFKHIFRRTLVERWEATQGDEADSRHVRPDRHVVLARATDSWGHVQPMRRDPDRRDAVISHVLRLEIEVR